MTDTTQNQTFEVPAGFTAIVREVDVIGEASAVTFSAYIKNSSIAPACTFYLATDAGVTVHLQWTGRVCVGGGGFVGIAWSSIGVSLNAYVGGYLLSEATPTP